MKGWDTITRMLQILARRAKRTRGMESESRYERARDIGSLGEEKIILVASRRGRRRR